jgi:hypothetical protein
MINGSRFQRYHGSYAALVEGSKQTLSRKGKLFGRTLRKGIDALFQAFLDRIDLSMEDVGC